MVLLLILSLSAAAALRGAVSGERFADNLRRQQVAEQQAEIALRYCEAELRKPDGTEAGLAPGLALRVPSLAEAQLARTEWEAPPAWREPANWIGAGAASGSRTVLPQDHAGASGSGMTPSRQPECLVEKQVLADGALVYLVTARGFSPGHPAAQPGPDAPWGGAVAWLQSTVLLGAADVSTPCPAAAPACASEDVGVDDGAEAAEAAEAANGGAGRRIHDRLWRRVLHPPVP